MAKETNNMKLWDAVKDTDKSQTKQVSQRGGFTSINAQYQVMRATEQFGPCGIGWGYDVEYQFVGTLVAASVTIWHGNREQKFGPVMGMNEVTSAKGRVDDDAPKKAMTDALTKALSHLGFSAEIYMGMWDDNKYTGGGDGGAAPHKADPNKDFNINKL